MEQTTLIHEDLSQSIIGCAMTVLNTLSRDLMRRSMRMHLSLNFERKDIASNSSESSWSTMTINKLASSFRISLSMKVSL